MLLVVGDLDRAPAIGFVDRPLHGSGDRVAVHDHVPVQVASRPADRLDQRAGIAHVTLFIGIEDRDEGDLWKVETLAQEVDADEHVEDAQP